MSETVRNETLPPLSTGGWFRWIWRQFTSMRTALILLFLLAVASIPGSIFPQRGVNPLKTKEWIADAPTWGPILDRLGFFEVYSSPWFSAIYILLFISLIGCVLPRAAGHWRAMRTPPPPAPRNLTRMQSHTVLDGADASSVDRAAEYLRAHRWHVLRGETDGAAWVSAEKGYLKETGNLLFHLALIFILIGVAVGGLFGWKGNVIVKNGDGFSDTLTQYDVWGGGRFADPAALPPFSFTLTDFRVQFDRSVAQRGSPSLFEADVTYKASPDAAAERTTIEVNYPLEADGAKVFLVGHGYAPRYVVRDSTGEIVFDDTVVTLPQDGNFTSTGVIKLPDANPQLGFDIVFYPTLQPGSIVSAFPAPDFPASYLAAWTGDPGLDTGIPQSVYRLDKTNMTQLGRVPALLPGQSWTLSYGQGSISLTGYERWASFQIAFDPGKELALLASALALTGLMLSLFTRRRRIWLKVSFGDNGTTVVEVAGLNRTEGGDVSADIQMVTQAIVGKEKA
jgi:cytochrome c biogenesis protein